ncbi:hypothetical protein BLNAU_12718 [Blattamonas nauphoetae]|uniref:Uncharacterized protein n=1 Tax=Blattamonas nauphoetae TaxID=2049346 RepID=A0ABQ9XKP8_9EUKA|nr:hypothetical protein BLNAU_12718 [Blattamonas nauphoetae]
MPISQYHLEWMTCSNPDQKLAERNEIWKIHNVNIPLYCFFTHILITLHSEIEIIGTSYQVAHTTAPPRKHTIWIDSVHIISYLKPINILFIKMKLISKRFISFCHNPIWGIRFEFFNFIDEEDSTRRWLIPSKIQQQ